MTRTDTPSAPIGSGDLDPTTDMQDQRAQRRQSAVQQTAPPEVRGHVVRATLEGGLLGRDQKRVNDAAQEVVEAEVDALLDSEPSSQTILETGPAEQTVVPVEGDRR